MSFSEGSALPFAFSGLPQHLLGNRSPGKDWGEGWRGLKRHKYVSGEGPAQEELVRPAFHAWSRSELKEYLLTKRIINLQRKPSQERGKPPAESVTPWGVEGVGVVRNVGIRNLVCVENGSSLECAKYGPGKGWPFQYP